MRIASAARLGTTSLLFLVPLSALTFFGCGDSDQATGPVKEVESTKKANNAMEEFMKSKGKMPGSPKK